MFFAASHRKAMSLPSAVAHLVMVCVIAFASDAAWADEANAFTASLSNQAVDGGVLMADRIVVRKSERRLYLVRNGQLLKSFRVALGLNPQGHKEREGDFRTPEGSYRLVRRNPRSDFFLSLQVSYPNDRDLARAQRMGVRPGGAIMLHGWPNTPRKNPEYYASADWTDGCIAMTNSDMVEIWLRTPVDTPIDIYP